MKTSFIVITFNQQDYIIETLQGIVSQSVLPDEVIIADDCSTDNTCKVIRDFISLYENINWICIFSDKNEGITKNLKKAIEISTGDILILNAGDDISLPNRIELSVKEFEKNPKSTIVTGNLNVIDSKGVYIREIIQDEKMCNDIEKTLRNGMPILFPVGQAIRKKIFDDFGPLPTDVPNEDDQISFYGMLAGPVKCIHSKLMAYRIHSKSASAWIRDNQRLKDYYKRFISDMPIRKRHMELWKIALSKSRYKNSNLFNQIISVKIHIYEFLTNIEAISIGKRYHFFIKNWRYLNLKEMYYILFGKFGILSWKLLRNLIRR